MKRPKLLPGLAIAVILGLFAGVFYGAGGAHADTDNIYGNSQSDCGSDLVVNTQKSASFYNGAGMSCLHLSSDTSTYVATTAPAGSATCPDKVIDSAGPTSGVAANRGGQMVCFYFKGDDLQVAPLTTAGSTTSSASTGCPDVATPGLKLDCTQKNPIYALLQFIINWAIRLLGALAVLAVIISGIQYIVSQGNPDGIKKAKSRLTNAIVGLILLSLMFVILHFLGVV